MVVKRGAVAYAVIVAVFATIATVRAQGGELWLDDCNKETDGQKFLIDMSADVSQILPVNAEPKDKTVCLQLENSDVPSGHLMLSQWCSRTTGNKNEGWQYDKRLNAVHYAAEPSSCIVVDGEAGRGAGIRLGSCEGPSLVSVMVGETTAMGAAGPHRLVHVASKLCVTRDDPTVVGCEAGVTTYPWCDYKLGIDERVEMLTKAMPVADKIKQLCTTAPASPKFGIPAYQWWSEAAHGVAAPGPVTSFPTSPAMAASRNMGLIRQVASAISDEGRALHNIHSTRQDGAGKVGLTFFAPNINIVRDPRWGRIMESYGEDPFLSGQCVTEFVKGMQEGEDSTYLKVVSTPKHYAAYSLEHFNGTDRTGYNAVVSDVDLLETYLPAFEAAVKAGAASVMCSYNAVNGVPSCANKRLLQDFLRNQWGFKGYVVSDCDAVANVFDPHHFTKTAEEAAAASLLAGTDLDCTSFYRAWLPVALQKGLITEEDVNVSFRRLFWHRFKLGMFDPVDRVLYNSLGADVIASAKHKDLALQAARESVVLLKNDGTLPLQAGTGVKTLAVIGPNADDADVILGNYNGTPDRKDRSTFRDGLQGYVGGAGGLVEVKYAMGARVDKVDTSMIAAAVKAAQASNAVVLCLGLNGNVEAESHDRVDDNMGADLKLTGSQLELARAVLAVKKPTVLVMVNGGAFTPEDVLGSVNAVVEAFYGGEQAGRAVAEVLFGDVNPSGRLPYTIYPTSWLEGTNFGDMDMHAGHGRTWKYTDQALFPFGAGLSYTTFAYSGLGVNHDVVTLAGPADDDVVTLRATVTNTGGLNGAEVLQVVATLPEEHTKQHAYLPRGKYVGFGKVFVSRGEAREVEISIHAKDLAVGLARPAGAAAAGDGATADRVVLPGKYALTVYGAGLQVVGEVTLTVNAPAASAPHMRTAKELWSILRDSVVTV